MYTSINQYFFHTYTYIHTHIHTHTHTPTHTRTYTHLQALMSQYNPMVTPHWQKGSSMLEYAHS